MGAPPPPPEPVPLCDPCRAELLRQHAAFDADPDNAPVPWLVGCAVCKPLIDEYGKRTDEAFRRANPMLAPMPTLIDLAIDDQLGAGTPEAEEAKRNVREHEAWRAEQAARDRPIAAALLADALKKGGDHV